MVQRNLSWSEHILRTKINHIFIPSYERGWKCRLYGNKAEMKALKKSTLLHLSTNDGGKNKQTIQL